MSSTIGDFSDTRFATTAFPLRRGAALRAGFIVLLLSTTLLERFGINFGSYSLNAALLGMYGFLAIGAVYGLVTVSETRLLLYVVCLAVAMTSAVVSEHQTSVSSLLLLIVMYLPYVFVLRPNRLLSIDADWALRMFLNIALLGAVAGICQFYAQFFVHADWLFDFGPYVPAFLRGPSGYNTVISVGALHKSNGFFFREPSGFSFITALAIIAESVLFKRIARLACLGMALLLTYSGTGILALVIGMLFPLGRKTIARVLVLGCAACLTLWLLGDTLNLSFTLGRLAEFGEARSSGYIRYIAPLRLVAENFDTEAWTLWLGHGPGTILRSMQQYEFHDPTWAKLLFEYGVLGFVSFFALVFVTVQRVGPPVQVRAALFFAWLLMGGHLLSPELNFLTLGLVGLLR